MQSRSARQQALDIALRTLAELEKQAAGYTSLTIPPSLSIDLDEKRKEVNRLENRLAGRQIDGFPDTLPRQGPCFGREREKERALEALSPQVRSWGVLIDGLGGIGKTALAIEIAHICRECGLFDAFLFSTAKSAKLDSDGKASIPSAVTTLADMVRDLSAQLGEPEVFHLIRAESQRGLLNVLQDFSGPDRRVLLVLDNLETFTKEETLLIIHFLSVLPQYCKAIITTRRRTGDGATWLRLESLEWEAARQIIEEKMRRASNLEAALSHLQQSQWQQLHNATGGSPLALTVALGLMSKRNLSLDRVLELLRTGPSGNQPLFEFVYDEARKELVSDEWRVLGALTISYSAETFEDILRLANLNPMALESALERLHAISLVDIHGPGGPYSLHPLTRQLLEYELAKDKEFAEAVLPPPIFRLPPALVSNLIGRDAAAKEIRERLAPKAGRPNVLVVRGWPGVGKTALAAAIARDPDVTTMFPQGVLWTSLEQRPNLLSEMAQLGRALGTDEIFRAPHLDEATAQLRDLLRHRRMLLIVDDVSDTAHGVPFTRVIGDQSALLITTRMTNVAEALTASVDEIYNLPILTEEDSLKLLRVVAPEIVDQSPEECLELVRDLEGLPLALQVAGRLLKSERKLGWGVSDLLREIREGARLIPEAAPIDRIGVDGIPTVSALLMKSTDMLDEFTRECFAYLAAFAPKPATFDLEALKAVWQVDDPNPIVRKLVAHGLLEPSGGGRFQMHRILVDHARSLCKP